VGTNLQFVRVTLPKTVASTPLSSSPLRGNVYFVKNGHALPDLLVTLRGQVAFDLVGRVAIVNCA